MHDDPLHTSLCDLLEIEYPILLAGMAPVALSKLVAAVSNAGGLGIIGAASLSPDELREEIREVRRLTNKPFGVDLLIALISPGVKEQIKVVLEEKVPVFVSGLGNPAEIVPDCHARGMKVIALVGNVKNANRCAQGGSDVIVAQGHEAGGHTGRIGTLALVPQVVDAVKPTPVVAAGGVGDGRGVVAALALGACGVLMGTRFIATPEAWGHPAYKEKVTQIGEEDTVVTRVYTGKTCRVISNQLTAEWRDKEDQIAPFPQQGAIVSKLLAEKVPSAQDFVPAFREAGHVPRGSWAYSGSPEYGFMPAGQISGMIKKIQPAGEVMASIIAEARQVLKEGLFNR